MNGETNNPTDSRELAFTFTGSGKEYFKIWIVNLALTILTLGVYSAWATVRSKRYFYGNTWLDGANFEYHATPQQLLFGRLLALFLLGVYLLLSQFNPLANLLLIAVLSLAIPWVMWRSLQFRARMSSYRNVRFGFSGSLAKAYLIPAIPLLIALVIGVLLSATIFNFSARDNDVAALGTQWLLAFIPVSFVLGTFYLLIPYLQKAYTSYYLNHSQYGQAAFSAQLSTGTYYGVYFKAFMLAMLCLALIALFVGIIGAAIAGFINTINPTLDNNSGMEFWLGLGVLLLSYVPALIIGALIQAYIQARLLNHMFEKLALDSYLTLHSSYSATTLWKLYLRNLMLLIITLGLAYPWVRVNLARYAATATQVTANTDLSSFSSQQQAAVSAVGEELGDVFDLNIGSVFGS